mmetsp:Transcript_8293/g.30599  ORF Transcript_8293/g.30599 Transcript_8293/m.30599 type:complete len:170 (-) Transcript_8293:2954-3463(-)
MKGESKVVVGTTDGALHIFSKGHFSDCSDRFTAMKGSSVDALVKLNEDEVVAGCSDGLIRRLSILPNRVLSIVGEHSDTVERMSYSSRQSILVSASTDYTVKVWNLGQQQAQQKDVADADDDINAEYQDDIDDVGKGRKRRGRKRGKHAEDSGKALQKKQNSAAFFSEL